MAPARISRQFFREVHNEAERIKNTTKGVIDDEVFDFIGKNLCYIIRPDLRDYINATALKESGLPWQQYLMNRWLEDKKLAFTAYAVNRAEAGDAAFETSDQRANAFQAAGHGVRSTFFEYQSKVLELAGKRRVTTPKQNKQQKDENDKHVAETKQRAAEQAAYQAQLEKDRTLGLEPSAAEYTSVLIKHGAEAADKFKADWRANAIVRHFAHCQIRTLSLRSPKVRQLSR